MPKKGFTSFCAYDCAFVLSGEGQTGQSHKLLEYRSPNLRISHFQRSIPQFLAIRTTSFDVCSNSLESYKVESQVIPLRVKPLRFRLPVIELLSVIRFIEIFKIIRRLKALIAKGIVWITKIYKQLICL